ncbi:MAG: hypothetical protein ACPGSG_07010 [Prolixibacteraceae bacterium]
MSEEIKNKGESSAPHSEDTGMLIVSVIKISASFVYLDEVIDSGRYYKHDFKKKASHWLNLMEKHTKPLLLSLSEENPDTLNKIYNVIADSLNKVQVGDTQKTSLICFYAFIKSALSDLNKMKENKDSLYTIFMRKPTEELIKVIETKYKFISEIVDSNGDDVNSLIVFLDGLGEKILNVK